MDKARLKRPLRASAYSVFPTRFLARPRAPLDPCLRAAAAPSRALSVPRFAWPGLPPPRP
eukprot:8007610-Heterocapsa_arctica.AAC.1